MIEMTLGEVASIVGGRLVGADPARTVTGTVEFDSRRVTPGGLFLAFPGERVDGHDYVGAAVEKGAVASLVTRAVQSPSIEIDDPLGAIAALAAAVIRRLPDVTVIGVTGSSGKTSTKDLLAQVLAAAGPTVAPPGSFNNELGHPYTVLRADHATRFLVLETSARGEGHIRYLTEIAPPRIGVVLNVGSAHLGEFGSRDAIARAKGELVEALPPDGVAVLNTSDQLVLDMRERTQARVVTFGEAADADVRAADIALDEHGRAAFRVVTAAGETRLRLGLAGGHHVGNALAAIAVGLECGLPFEQVARGVEHAVPVSRWRMETTTRADGLTIINDTYNANPESMGAALTTLAHIAHARRRGASWAVLGPMAELGDDAPAEHRALGRVAARLDIAHVIAVGENARPILDAAALESSWAGDARWVPDVDSALELLQRELRGPDVVLVKASRAARLERVALALIDGTGKTASDGGGGTA